MEVFDHRAVTCEYERVSIGSDLWSVLVVSSHPQNIPADTTFTQKNQLVVCSSAWTGGMPTCCCDWFDSHFIAEIAADWLQIDLRGGIPEARHNAWPADLVWAFDWVWGVMWGVLRFGLHSGWRVTRSVWQYIWSDGEFQQQSSNPAFLSRGPSVRSSFEAVSGCSDRSSVCASCEQIAS